MTNPDGNTEPLVGGRPMQLATMDSTFVSADVLHYFKNTGAGRLVILWFYGAGVVIRTFTETGEIVPHVSPRDLVWECRSQVSQ